MLTGIGTKQNIQKSTNILTCSGPEQQPATLVADTPINLWGRDLLMQWGAYVTIPTISSQAKQIMANMGYNPVQNTQVVGATTKQQKTALKLTWESEEPIWTEQWPLSHEKLQVLEQLVEEQLSLNHIASTTSPLILLSLLSRRNLGNGEMLINLRKVSAAMKLKDSYSLERKL